MTNIETVLYPENIRFDLQSNDKEVIIRELMHTLRGDKRIVDIDAALNDVLEHEKVTPSSVGNGVAIPHARSKHVTEICLASAVFHQAIPQPEGEPLHFIILAIVPNTMATKYLQILGSLARVFSKTENCNALLECETAETFIGTIKKLSRKF